MASEAPVDRFLYQRLIRPWLFRRDAEEAHRAMVEMLARWRIGTGAAERALRVVDPRLATRLWEIDFANPIGLAAGMDKHGEAVGAWRHLGFGSVEIGTVTPRPQDGNPRPRVFRVPEVEAIINRMGFNSIGAEAVSRNLGGARARIPVGVNLGRNRETPNESAAHDYRAAMAQLIDHADYLVVNVSSPNTPRLRELQEPAAVARLVRAVVDDCARLSDRRGRRAPPVLVKLAPDFAPRDHGDALERTVDAALDGGCAGFIATNTTLAREGLRRSPASTEAGGLSGPPLRGPATEIVRRAFRHLDGRAPIIGAGGVSTAEDAYEKVRAGASLVQIYTALVYQGPTVVRRINRGLLGLLERDGVARLADAVGADA